jgi:hypothetical protein
MTAREKKCLDTYDHAGVLAKAVTSRKSINIFVERGGTAHKKKLPTFNFLHVAITLLKFDNLQSINFVLLKLQTHTAKM